MEKERFDTESTRVERLGGAETIIRGILEEFRGLNQVPHGSRNEKAESDYLMERLRRMGLSPVRDTAGNVMADVPAVPGQEDRPHLILQGHMDMVCTVRPPFDPLRDTPRLVVEDGVLRTDGNSTLGADNNLGNATVLWLLEQGLAHGPLRLLFTVCEEVGLQGARQVDPAWLSGAYGLLNTDGFHLGRDIAGSAGGRRKTYARPLETEPEAEGAAAWRLRIRGGTGGHSGDDIHKGRLNAVRELAAFLSGALEDGFRAADFAGGSAHNAIPMEAAATLTAAPDQAAELERRVAALAAALREKYGKTDPALAVELVPCPVPERVWSRECAAETCALATGLFNGVYAMHPDFPQVVGASANVGRVFAEDGKVKVMAFIRCARRAEEEILFAQHDDTAAKRGFAMEEVSCYHGWPGSPNSRLIRVLCGCYRRESGEEMEVTAVHVGLEPSVLGEKNPELVMVSTGPEILDAHSVDERAPLEGLPRYAATLAGVLEEI